MKPLTERIEKIKQHIERYEKSLIKADDKKLLGLNFSNKEADELMLKRLNNCLKKLTN